MQGASVDFIVCDEPMPKPVFEELTARLMDRKGRMLMVLTPVDDKPDNWIWVRDDLYIPFETGERKDVNIIYMPVADAEGNSLVPHFTNDDIRRMEERWPDPAVRAARMYGHFVTRAGLVFGSVDPKIHTVPRFPIPDTWDRWIAVDPQYHRFAALFFAADDEGNYYVTDEYYSQDEQLAYRAQRMKAILGPRKLAVPCYVDSANPQDIAELNYHFNQIGAKIGAIKLPIQKKVEQMILRVHSRLEPSDRRKYHWRTGRKNIYGAPRLLFFNDLMSTWDNGQERIQASRLMWELKRLSWSKNGSPDKDSAGGADCCDALVYGCSIAAQGRPADELNDPYKDMKPEDAIIWRAIDMMEERERIAEEHRWIY
jgi:hypothetical protein